MVVLLLMAAAPAPAPAGEARRVMEAQLKAPVREDAELSAEEAAVIRRRYLESIGRRVERAVDGAR
ncbi:hypothetical protein A0J57_21660 [Sphingobium sp. 22B]|uniref:hypothetical protein n=1 Tax=unclassified Sphingobium TaxID=2611147 RepID=UPI00078039B5|nr:MULTISPECIES: hypothetical protein [unclassified Sphingobium]KXU31687.1 hypothetical protein AXW74_11595 [Sphingobium sp. AM]KYC30244.1 hypothetical protein A0J57_21660 [Sphingobium sp. 22B]OAP30634.1 hypothetical protein A8O16_17755 [Sphingobium sp. 20006FA]